MHFVKVDLWFWSMLAMQWTESLPITQNHTKSAPLSTLTLIQLKTQISKTFLTRDDHYLHSIYQCIIFQLWRQLLIKPHYRCLWPLGDAPAVSRSSGRLFSAPGVPGCLVSTLTCDALARPGATLPADAACAGQWPSQLVSFRLATGDGMKWISHSVKWRGWLEETGP